MEKLVFWTIWLPDEAMSLIVDSVIIKHALENNNVDMYNLSGFYKLINRWNLNRIAFLDFAMCRRENLVCEKLSGSPMHLLFLGKINALVINWYLIIIVGCRNV